ncbi:MAG: ABC transporter permease [Isosphaeraceae bacterium]|nr:ABC transporter permease [Isosphaeraceae bacterium]
MRKIWVVAAREFNVAVRSKAFLISLVSMPIFMVGSLVVQMLIKQNEDKSDQKYAVIDRSSSGAYAKVLESAAARRNESQLVDPKTGNPVQSAYRIEIVPPASGDAATDEQRLALSDRVRKGELEGFLEIGPDLAKASEGSLPVLDGRRRPINVENDRAAVKFQTDTPLKDEFPNWAVSVLHAVVMQQKSSAAGITPQLIEDALRPVPLVVTRLTKRDPQTGAIQAAKSENRALSLLLPMGLSLLMFMMILVSTTPLLNSVLEEKTARIAEVLLGSVTPFQLMMGKLLGMLGVSLISVALYLGGVYFAAVRYGFADSIPTSLIVWFLVFQSLGVLMFGSLFIAIGAASNDAKDSQSLITPVMLLATIPFFVMVSVIEKPNGGLATGMSFFPFASPSIMVMRLAVPPGIPTWQPWAATALVVATSIACVWAGSRVFRVGLLMQGKSANFAQMLKWVING